MHEWGIFDSLEWSLLLVVDFRILAIQKKTVSITSISCRKDRRSAHIVVMGEAGSDPN